MDGFTEIHGHFVYGVDDGAQTEETMQAMLDAAAKQGVTRMFATSHVTPGMEKFPQEAYERHLEQARPIADVWVIRSPSIRAQRSCTIPRWKPMHRSTRSRCWATLSGS